MEAKPVLISVARALRENRLEAVMIGNAGAALQGAPVTTLDVDFLFRKTPQNLRKLKAVARALDAVILKPYYPVSGLFRLVRETDGLQLDFMMNNQGVGSYNSLRARAKAIPIDDEQFLVEPLVGAVTGKRTIARQPTAKKDSKQPVKRRKKNLEALKCKSDLGLRDQIRRLLAKPPEERTNFLRKRIGLRGSCL
jgi:hypothetical protein